MYLRGLGVNLAFEGLFAADIHLDLLGLGFGLLGKATIAHKHLFSGSPCADPLTS